ncbi:hypothetical protein KC363_g7352 [Hortaea werneckii]|uniref:Cyanovirin-N domain-containing protein n=1 Tax=Hortaea werneckii TaxID=91943 RepID=A0A3M7FIQ7_HORWE|nr:hypothetical protein KC361_g5554 [Hortaea werneckii]KAI6879662.1 hypothetical protein KC325_g7807 [Hortaea werneckii]KAI6990614.1 hypothetical protein KC359_g6584 [Hortaea werneckii]KAI7141761.1 hypothetical protein KC344_g7748 [Hortaea werneckii]KAI7171497.1 hypothetical protein KC360_g6120 [Hortaea werneckii]
MTRNQPQAPPYDYSQGGGYGYGFQQPQYGGNEASYGTYNTGEAYGQAGDWQQPQYGADASGSAQSYYGSNDQAYQQYPPSYGGYGSEQQHYQTGPPPPMYGGQQYAPQDHSQYGGPPSYPPYNAPTADSDVDAFKSHYEQPYGPVDPSSSQPAAEDRGVMGALAGGAAGAYGGHKMKHGFLGGIGGAVAGSMLEDAYKKKSKKDKKEKKQKFGRRGSSSSSSSSSSDSSDDEKKKVKKAAAGAAMAGNFHASSHNMRLEGRCTLVADCKDTNGHHRSSRLDLNNCFTNTNGDLRWARGGNFAQTARHIRLVDDGRAIEAELGDGRGGWKRNVVRLGERITNDNGNLAML